MKLYIVGESSSNPGEWSEWSEWSLVIAESPDQAIRISGDSADTPVTEIPLDHPVLLCKMGEPNWGKDT